MGIDSVQFRSTLAQWASGVTVVTTAMEGKLYGMTASSFSSVSLDPPLILVCIAKYAHTYQMVRERGGFGVNILSAAQAELGRRFAEKHADYIDRFTDLDVLYGETGAPLIANSMAWLDCQTHETVEAGDHTIFIGKVVTSQVYGGEPLIYFNRLWGGFTPLR